MRCIGIFFGFDVVPLKVCSYVYSLMFRPNGVSLPGGGALTAYALTVNRLERLVIPRIYRANSLSLITSRT